MEKDRLSRPNLFLFFLGESEVLMLLFVWRIGGERDRHLIRCGVGTHFCVVQQLSQRWPGIRCNMAL